MPRSWLLVPCVLGALALAAQSPSPPPAAGPARTATVVRPFVLEGDLEKDSLNEAVAELSLPDAPARIALGPLTSSTRSDKAFVELEVPASVPPKAIARALKKCGARAVELEWTVFRGAPEEPTSILGYSARDCVIGMASEMRWFEHEGGTTVFFYLPGKLDAEALADRYGKLYQPFGKGDVGTLARDELTWHLAEPLDGAKARAAEKAIAKLTGVVEVALDVGARTLRVAVELDGLSASAPAPKPKKDALATALRFPSFDANPVLDALAANGLALAPESKPGSD